MPQNWEKLRQAAASLRYWILKATTAAGSGHPSSSLSAVELLTVLFFGGFFRYDLRHPEDWANDRLIFSKGHAAPLLYALYALAGAITWEELLTLRQKGSVLEGHPTPRFLYHEVATGSLGQGLAMGMGMAWAFKYLHPSPARVFVLLGDSEMSEGSNWEVLQLASYYQLNNLVALLDVNRLGQRGPTMYGHDLEAYQKRITAMGWQAWIVEGHNLPALAQIYQKALTNPQKPQFIIARTLKGKGVSLLENREGWHGKVLSPTQLKTALAEINCSQPRLHLRLSRPRQSLPAPHFSFNHSSPKSQQSFFPEKELSTREAFGRALAVYGHDYPQLVVLDAEVSNSTYTNLFKKQFPQRFWEMFIAEQSMVGAAIGLAQRGYLPVVSTFAAFLSRAYDQIRMAQYSRANIKIVGSHAGVSIGADGPSQMGLEDLAFFRTLRRGIVFYPADAVSTFALLRQALDYRGLVYLRTTRPPTPLLYRWGEKFPLGGSKTLRSSSYDKVTLVAAGITLFEALKAAADLQAQGIAVRVIDCYSIKPIDRATLRLAARQTELIVVVEDHYPEGGLAAAVREAVNGINIPVLSLAVNKIPQSGSGEELLDEMGLSAKKIEQRIYSFFR